VNSYFTPVASMPGFPKALARTIHGFRWRHWPGSGPGTWRRTISAGCSRVIDSLQWRPRAGCSVAADAVREGRPAGPTAMVLLDRYYSASDAGCLAAIAAGSEILGHGCRRIVVALDSAPTSPARHDARVDGPVPSSPSRVLEGAAADPEEPETSL